MEIMIILTYQSDHGLHASIVWGQDKMANILQMTFQIYSCMKKVVFWFKFHLILSQWFLINKKPALIQIMTWHKPSDKPLPELIMAWFIDTWALIQYKDVVLPV